MYASAELRLREPQTVANLIMQQSVDNWILFGIPKVRVPGDVVQFRNGPATKPGLDLPILPRQGRSKPD